ncbi:hypothetical protein D3W54_03110 [Komagataeibacter medellinensis]|uniref:Uncharacterized protein n=1 Tax=Komagataeibacter medellinensis TaxID=1177712 RepID=A0ABQ6VT50_9PROT|nr:hypothetical protein [Komagataeibacter medellinensis]KAB8123362.1 hypothetical protein D3W54_03110 [Komagataeibacter medellinensis]
MEAEAPDALQHIIDGFCPFEEPGLFVMDSDECAGVDRQSFGRTVDARLICFSVTRAKTAQPD